jgi:hypothetical protein
MRRIIIVVLALGCEGVSGDLLPDADQLDDGGQIKKGRPEPADAAAAEMPGEAAGEAAPEVPEDAAPSACIGKKDDEVCGMETCADTIAMHYRCRSGVCVKLIEDCTVRLCSIGVTDRYWRGTCLPTTSGSAVVCAPYMPASGAEVCPAGQICMPITPVVAGGASGSCVAASDGGAG